MMMINSIELLKVQQNSSGVQNFHLHGSPHLSENLPHFTFSLSIRFTALIQEFIRFYFFFQISSPQLTYKKKLPDFAFAYNLYFDSAKIIVHIHHNSLHFSKKKYLLFFSWNNFQIGQLLGLYWERGWLNSSGIAQWECTLDLLSQIVAQLGNGISLGPGRHFPNWSAWVLDCLTIATL